MHSSYRQHYSASSNPNVLLDRHSQTVNEISASVQQFYERKEKFRIFHGSTNSTRPGAAMHEKFVDTSSLTNVLSIDRERRTALVEPNVPMDRLVEETMKYGLMPPVVMEFPGITVGGGYAGTSGESSSFKHGFFNRNISSVEMVLASGDVITCSGTENPDLFHGAAGAAGTLGITTLVELQLREMRRYVETTYHPVSSVSEAIDKIKDAMAEPEIDYIDGILFSKRQGAIVTGRLTDSVKDGMKTQRFSSAKDPWFYLHVQDLIGNSTNPVTEAIPVAEYLFRYDRGGFWVGASAFEYFKVPFNSFTRWFLDDFLHTRMMYKALHASGQSRNYVVQDLALPFSTAEQFIDYTDEVFKIYPLWLCPLRQSPLPTMHPHSRQTEADGDAQNPLLNIGLWGSGPIQHSEFVTVNIDLERKLREFGGMKWLYAHTYYTEREFWEVYDRKWYDALREKYDAASLPSVYEKVKVHVEKDTRPRSFLDTLLGIWPISGLYGVLKAIESGTYIEARNSSWKKLEDTHPW